VVLAWDLPVKLDTWDSSTKAFRFRRTFKWFGHNAPAQYVVPSAPSSALHRITWSLTDRPSLVISAGTTVQLDGKYENLGAGQRLLIVDSGASGTKTLVTIEKVEQVNATFGPLADTVTELEVKPVASGVTQVPEITSRQKVVIYELEGDGRSRTRATSPETRCTCRAWRGGILSGAWAWKRAAASAATPFRPGP
jgi:hypothetical protein